MVTSESNRFVVRGEVILTPPAKSSIFDQGKISLHQNAFTFNFQKLLFLSLFDLINIWVSYSRLKFTLLKDVKPLYSNLYSVNIEISSLKLNQKCSENDTNPKFGHNTYFSAVFKVIKRHGLKKYQWKVNLGFRPGGPY